MKKFKLMFCALYLIAALHGAVLVPTSYDMRNGGSGTYIYQDRSYTGSGDKFTNYSPLTGGLGDLTDGVIPTLNWFSVENPAGTGPYVGWTSSELSQPNVTFRFGGPVTINSIVVYADDSNGSGGVNVPLSIDVGLEGGPYVNYSLASPAGSAPAAFTLSGLNLFGSAVDLRFNYSDSWIMLSEVTFEGASDASQIPEPSTGLLAFTAFAGFAMWRRRS